MTDLLVHVTGRPEDILTFTPPWNVMPGLALVIDWHRFAPWMVGRPIAFEQLPGKPLGTVASVEVLEGDTPCDRQLRIGVRL